jgi:hypothetical protein
MWVWTIITSLLIIFIIDNLVTYFKDTYTTKKTKDVVGFHIQKYQTIMDELQETNEKEKADWLRKLSEAETQSIAKDKTDLTEIDLRTINEDLSDFIQRQINQM